MQYRAEFPVHFPSPVLKKSGQLKENVQEILQFRVVMCLQEMCMQVVYPGTGNLDIRPVLFTMFATPLNRQAWGQIL